MIRRLAAREDQRETITASHKGIIVCGDEPSTHNIDSILT